MKKIVNLPKLGQKGFRAIPLAERFFSKIQFGESCWIWLASTNDDGYGWIKYRGRMRHAHRVMYENFVRPIPSGKLILHRCDVRACVNPAHLFVGDQFDNMRDMFSKNRGNPGGHNRLD